MKKQIQIGTFTFESLEKATKFMQRFVSSRIEQMPIEEFDFFLRKSKEFEFLMELLKRHPYAENKIGCGVRSFEVVKTAYNNYGLYLTRLDGSCTDFSWRECLKGTPEDLAMKGAMRKSIEYQIKDYVRDHTHRGQICCLCNEREAEHVDHVPPNTFEEIAQRFISWVKKGRKGPISENLPLSYDGKNDGLGPEKDPFFEGKTLAYGGKNTGENLENGLVLHQNVIDTYSVDGQMGRGIVDPVIEKQWQDYHENQAVLRYLCGFCNLSTSKKEHNAYKLTGHRGTQN